MSASAAAEHRESVLHSYLLHLRPAEWPIVLVHMLVGWWLATGARIPNAEAWLGILAWVVLLNGGTLALNSAFDHDEGDVAFLRNPPPPPPHLAAFGFGLMLLGLGLTLPLPWHYRLLYLICMAMSIVYSVPPIRLKGTAGMDWLINMLGFGTLTPLAAWAISGRPLHGPYAAILWAFTPLFAALYPLTQIYQIDEDRARGDRTLAVRLGIQPSLTLAIFTAGIGFGMLAMAGWESHWHRAALIRWSLIGVSAMAWIVVLLPWYARGRSWSSARHQQAMYHALVAWALTDLAVLLCWVR
jgi:4-hydroxybenzoate polyprenyltransferase